MSSLSLSAFCFLSLSKAAFSDSFLFSFMLSISELKILSSYSIKIASFTVLHITIAEVLCCHHRLIIWYLIALDGPVLQEYSVERICQRLQCFFSFDGLQLTFPDRDGVPAHRGQFMLYFHITLLVPLYFIGPELCIGLRYGVITTALMSMPEATINKDTCSILPQHDVWLPWKSWMIQTIAVAMPPQITSHHHLGFRVLCPNMAHTAMTLFYGQDIVHCYFDLTCRFIFM